MKLYGFAPSPNTWKARAVAAYLGVKLDYEHVDLMAGGSHTPQFLAINPTGRTPALVDGDFKLWETVAIVQYIAGQKPNSLYPDNVKARADIARWQSWQLVHWSKEGCEPLIFQRLVKKFMNLGALDEAVVAKGLECFNKEATMLDAHLAKQPYLVGTELTLADFSAAAPLFYAKDVDMPLAPYANIQQWFGRVSALPCWGETAPERPAQAA